ncbi:SMY2 Protein SMY2 [Candida maltosa Xu316]
MYSRSRKSQEIPNNGNIDDNSTFSQHYSHSSNNNNHHHHHHHHHQNHSHHHNQQTPHTNTIPANKDGKQYTMNEVFQVWYDNKDQILNSNVPLNGDESYKLSQPEPIYHLDLQGNFHHDENLSKETTKEVTDSLEKLSISGKKDSDLDTTIGSAPTATSSNTTLASTTTGAPLPPGMVSLPKDLGGLESRFRPLVTSDKIEWYYIDPSGNEQGPFVGDMMQEWLAGGYLNLDLKIRRKEEGSFKTLRDLCEELSNYVTPFKIPLPDLASVPTGGLGGGSQFFPNDLSSATTNTTTTTTNNNNNHTTSGNYPPFQSSLLSSLGNVSQSNISQANLFANDYMNPDPFSTNALPQSTANQGFNSSTFGIDTFSQQPTTTVGMDSFNQNLGFPSMPSILQQQIHQQQQPSLSRVNSGWGMDSTSSILQPGSNPQTPIGGGHVSLSSQISQPAPISPWLPSAVTQSHSRVNSPFTSTTNLSLGTQEPLNVQPESNVPQQEDPVFEQIQNSVVTDFLNDEEPKQVEQQPQVQQQEQPVKKQPQQQTVAEEVKPVVRKEVEEPKEAEIEPIKPVELKPSQTAPAPVLAPWASATTNATGTSSSDSNAASKTGAKKPALTLKEIQKLEAEKVAEQKRIEAQIKSEQAARAWANAAAAEKAAKLEKAAPALPSTWGSTPTVPVTKTLAEIQKEEAERARAKQVAAAAAANKLNTNGLSNTPSFASALANSVPKDDGPAWTTVSSKKPLAPAMKKAASATTISTSTPASKTTPQLLRSVSANKQNTTTVNAQAIREDFLVWARSNMTSLYPTVSKEDLLDIFITLPPNSADSASLIAETIYSSSATMDGRRFAQEFLKRRQKVDQQIGGGDHVSWSAAIISSADKIQTVDEDGWSTSFKSKKKNNKRN